jgi:hypothetical protein
MKILKNLNSKIVYGLMLLVPSVTFAALNGLKGLLIELLGMMNTVVAVVFGFALVFFFWGGAQFILNDAGNDKTREEGKKKILWSVIALFIMFSIYGILRMIGNLTGISTNGGVSPTSIYNLP